MSEKFDYRSVLPKDGGYLTVYRGTSPHNQMIYEKQEDIDWDWHSDGYRERIPGRYIESLEVVEQSERVVPHGSLHRDGGKPWCTVYRIPAQTASVEGETKC